MKENTKSFHNLVHAFRYMDQSAFLRGIQNSCDCSGSPKKWKTKADNQIDKLEIMASHGDEESFKFIIEIGIKISAIVNNLAGFALQDNLKDDLFNKFNPDDGNDSCSTSTLSINDLINLDSLADENFFAMINDIEDTFPDLQTSFFPKYLFVTPENKSAGLPVKPDKSLLDRHNNFLRLSPLTAILAAIRKQIDCSQMVRNNMAHAKLWPLALQSIQEYRAKQLKEYEEMKIGNRCNVSPYAPKGRGNALGFAEVGMTDFAYRIYEKLEEERSRHRTPEDLESMRSFYENCCNHQVDSNDEGAKWNQYNKWVVDAAFLEPLSDQNEIINSWVDTAMKFIVTSTNLIDEIIAHAVNETYPTDICKILPVSFLNKVKCAKKDKHQTAINAMRTWLKKGLKALVGRIESR